MRPVANHSIKPTKLSFVLSRLQSISRFINQEKTCGGRSVTATGGIAPSSAAYRCLPSVANVVDVDSQRSDASALRQQEEAEEVLRLVSLLPPRVRKKLQTHPELPRLVEVVMDLGRPPFARFPGQDVRLSDSAVTAADLQDAIDACGDFGGDNRAGIDGTLHRISAIRNRQGKVVGLTCRVGRAIRGSAAMIADLATAGRSILLLGRPGVGKTTAIREISRLLADELRKRVVIVDTSNEIGGDGDVPHPGIGGARRMQVTQPELQHRVMIEAVENHMPEVIVIDEIGTEAEALAARTIAQRGVQLIATAHGNELENVMKNPSLSDLVGGITSVTLGDDEARRRGVQKSVLERESPPTFDVAIEMDSRERWRVHLDVGSAVDALLMGREANAEVRERDEQGRVWAWPEDASTDSDDDRATGKRAETSSSTGDSSRVASGEQRAHQSQRSRERVVTQPFPEAAIAAARREVQEDETATAFVAFPQPRAKSSTGGGGRTKAARAAVAAMVVQGTPLRLFLYGIDSDSVLSVADALDNSGRLEIVGQIQEADAVLASRPRLKTSGWIRAAAQTAKVPVFTVRSSSVEDVVRGVRTLLGVDPSPGNIFSFGNDEGSPAGADPLTSPPRKVLRPETSMEVITKGKMKASSPPGALPASAAAVRDGLAEARAAIEAIVLPHGQPAELMPRKEEVVERQVALAQGYGLKCEVAGTAAAGGRRVRVLPMGWMPGTGEARQVDASSGGTNSAKEKEYW